MFFSYFFIPASLYKICLGEARKITSLLGTPRHEQSPLSKLLPKFHLSQILEEEVFPHPSAYKYLPDALLREPVVRHSPNGLLIRSHFHVGSAVGSMAATAMAIAVMVVMMVMPTIRRPRTMRGVWQEVNDHQYAARPQPRREPLCR